MKLNLPNKLTLLRMLMVPFLMVFIVFDFGMPTWLARVLAAFFFAAASFTDFLDGHIARKHNLITNFGKFMDPLADKLMVFVALISLCYTTGRDEGASVYGVCVLVATVIVIFRELAVTSMRMVVTNTDGIVIAANWLGKVKTCTQIAAILVAILEPIFAKDLDLGYTLLGGHVASYVLLVAMSVMTLWSGFNYFKSYWKYINPAN